MQNYGGAYGAEIGWRKLIRIWKLFLPMRKLISFSVIGNKQMKTDKMSEYPDGIFFALPGTFS